MKVNGISDIIFRIMLPIVSLILFLSSIILEILSNKSMGIYRYLTFKNKVFEEKFFTENLTFIYRIILIVVIFLSIILLIKSLLKSKNKYIVMNLILLILVELFLLYVLINYSGLDFNALLQIAFSIFFIFLTLLIKTIYIYYFK